MAPKSLLDLPPELRNDIYAHVLVIQQPIALTERQAHPRTLTSTNHKEKKIILDKKKSNPDLSLGLLSTCRQIRQEAFPMFLGSNSFHFGLPQRNWAEDDECTIHRQTVRAIQAWLASLGRYSQFLKSVEFQFDWWDAWKREPRRAPRYDVEYNDSVDIISQTIRELQTSFPRETRLYFHIPVHWTSPRYRRISPFVARTRHVSRMRPIDRADVMEEISLFAVLFKDYLWTIGDPFEVYDAVDEFYRLWLRLDMVSTLEEEERLRNDEERNEDRWKQIQQAKKSVERGWPTPERFVTSYAMELSSVPPGVVVRTYMRMLWVRMVDVSLGLVDKVVEWR